MHLFHPARRKSVLGFGLGLLITVASLPAQVVSYTISGTLVSNFFIGITNYPVNTTTYELVVAWDTSASPTTPPTSTQAQYALTEFTFSLVNGSSTWTTTALAANMNLYISGNNQQIQFTTSDLSDTTIGPGGSALFDYSLNLTLVDTTNSYGGGLSGLGSAPPELLLSDWNPSVSDNGTNLKIYHTNSGNGNRTLGNINSIGLTAVPEPSTYALFVGLGVLMGSLWWRRRQSQG